MDASAARRPLGLVAGLLILSALGAARAATCPSTCVTFDDEADAAAYVTMVATGTAEDMKAFLAQAVARHAARVMPNGTQFVLLDEHKVAAAKSSYYGIQLPGAYITRYLVAVK